MHHFEIVSSAIEGDEFRIVLRNSITGHEMTFLGSPSGLFSRRGRHATDDHVRRLAGRLLTAVNAVDRELIQRE